MRDKRKFKQKKLLMMMIFFIFFYYTIELLNICDASYTTSIAELQNTNDLFINVISRKSHEGKLRS